MKVANELKEIKSMLYALSNDIGKRIDNIENQISVSNEKHNELEKIVFDLVNQAQIGTVNNDYVIDKKVAKEQFENSGLTYRQALKIIDDLGLIVVSKNGTRTKSVTIGNKSVRAIVVNGNELRERFIWE